MRLLIAISLSILIASCNLKGPNDEFDRPLNITSSPVIEQSPQQEQQLDPLTAYFAERNTTLCEIYKILGKHEAESFKAAAREYPNNYDKQTEYQIKLYKEKRDQVFSKYNIDPSMSTKISAQGFFDCPPLD